MKKKKISYSPTLYSPTSPGPGSRALGQIGAGVFETLCWTRLCPERFPNSRLLLWMWWGTEMNGQKQQTNSIKNKKNQYCSINSKICPKVYPETLVWESIMNKIFYRSFPGDRGSEGLGTRDLHWSLWERCRRSARPQCWGCCQRGRGAAAPREHHLVEINKHYNHYKNNSTTKASEH